GDLIFAYFDFDEPEICVENALRSAIEISRLNAEMNETLPPRFQIKRFILLSYGEAVVGNLSGYDSAIEITAIGSPVNFLSRLDELTKTDSLKALLHGGDILITPEMVEKMRQPMPGINLIEIDLKTLWLQVRDFENTEKIFVLRVPDIITVGAA